MRTSKTTWASRRGCAFAAACAAAVVASVAMPRVGFCEELSATAQVESQDVSLGEPFSLQVRVSGADSPGKPDLSGLTDFSVRELGASRSGQSSFTIVVNGRQIQSSSASEVTFSFELVAKKEGALLIPPIPVAAQGKMVHTTPIQIRVNRPTETAEFKLRQSLSKACCYVGEPVILRVIWYVGTKVSNYQLNMPVFGNDAFVFADPHDGQYSTVQVAGGTVAAVQGRSDLDGRQYDAIEFSKVLIPRKAGMFEIPPATVTCAALAGHQKQSSPFGDDFPFFNTMREVYKKVVVPSGSVTIEVLPVPQAGRPANYAGHVGEYRIAASATPVEVSVGDPITLTIAISGPEYLDNVELPPLAEQSALVRDFKIPAEIAAGKIGGGSKVFTQSIRALREDVQAIPPIELPYFDTKSGKYGIAKSAPIPLTVKATRVITPGMGVGGEPVMAGSALEAWGKGIAHNYEGPEMLEDQRSGPAAWIRSPVWVCSLALPPSAYLVVLALTVAVRRRRADPLSMKARKALGQFVRTCNMGGVSGGRTPSLLLEAMREYLGSRLKVPSAAMSFKDVEAILPARGVDQGTMTELRLFFERCEADSYAGGSGKGGEDPALAEKALKIAREIERKLR